MPRSLRDAIYEACSDAATGRQFLEDVANAGPGEIERYDHPEPGRVDPTRLPLPALLHEMARLTFLHRSIARYYYTELYLPSRDVASFFEYLYHRISSVRYGTSLASLVCQRYDDLQREPAPTPRAEPGREDPPDPVFAYIKHILKEPNCAQRERSYDLRGLLLALRREREVLLSLVPSLTLQGWIDWVLKEDIRRFRLDQFNPKAPRGLDKNVERGVKRQCRKVSRGLREMLGISLRDSTNYVGCIRHHLVTVRGNLEKVLGSEPPDAFPNWLRVLEALDEAKAAGTRPPDLVGILVGGSADDFRQTLVEFRRRTRPNRQRPKGHRPKGPRPNSLRRLRATLDALTEIANALRGLSRTEAADGVLRMLEYLRNGKFDGHPVAEIPGPSQIKYLFRKAALLHESLGGWEMKNGGRRARTNLERACQEILKVCDEGLEEVRQVTDRMNDYLLNRNYFLTLRARALALRGDFSACYRAFDQALSGLDMKVGKVRVAGAACTLRFAEALMFRSDQYIMAECRAALDRLLVRPAPVGAEAVDASGPLAWGELSTSGRFYVLFERRAEEALGFGAGSDPSAIQLLRRAATPWACGLASGGPSGAEFLAGVHASMELLRAIDGSTSPSGEARNAAEKLWDFEKNSPADGPESAPFWQDLSDSLKQGEAPDVDPADVEGALGRSLAYWRSECLRGLTTAPKAGPTGGATSADSGPQPPPPLDLVRLRQAAWRHLFRTRDALERAERLLASGRRDVAFWRLLHRARAEMHFERLLLKITLGPPRPTAEGVEYAHRKFHDEFLSDLQAGLRSIRRALDCCLAQEGEEDDRHVAGLRRLWAQFLIVTVANAQIRRSEWRRQRELESAVVESPEEWIEDKLRARWLWVNKAAGLAREVDRRIEWLIDVKDDVEPYLDNTSPRTEWLIAVDDDVEPYLNYARQMLGTEPEQLSKHSLAARAFVERHLKLFADPVCERQLNGLPAATSTGGARRDEMGTYVDGTGSGPAPADQPDQGGGTAKASDGQGGTDSTA